MKELSIEQKARRYDEILARAEGANLPYYKEDIMSKVKEFVDYLIPELKVSEDEKIRQFLIHEVTETSDEIMSYRNMNKKDILAWLEKQRDKDKLIQELGEYKVKYTQEVLSQHLEKQGGQNLDNSAKNCKDEQKPKEKTKIYDSMDDLIADALIEEIEGSELDDRGKYNRIHWIESHRQKHTWSEDDIKMFVNIKACLRNANKDYSRELDWLKSIKPQSKQEWCEEDEWKFSDIMTLLRGGENCHYNTPELFEWFKTIKDRVRPKPTWKPTEEQMETLEYYMHTLLATEHKEMLFGLYNDLKKL